MRFFHWIPCVVNEINLAWWQGRVETSDVSDAVSFKVIPTQRIPYKKIADEIGYSANEVKELFQSINEKLSGDKTLKNYIFLLDVQKNSREWIRRCFFLDAAP